MKTSDWRFRTLNQISTITADQWNRCANPSTHTNASARHQNPFTSHEFLNALEQSGCVGSGTGWTPAHLILEDISAHTLLAAVPMYIKDHSHGEYVFDFQWAEAFERAGGQYYPKLQVSIPFTPVTGPRLLINSDQHETEIKRAVIEKTIQIAKEINVSSLHYTFLPRTQWEELGEAGFLKRTDQQFQWRNDHYSTFDDFLARLSTKKRRNIRRERRIALESGITIEWITGRDITESHWDTFFQFYMDTGSRKWGSPYLNRRFFSMLGNAMPEDILLIFGYRNGEPIAGALNLIGRDTLYGRYWGCLDDYPCLHFEICYYQAIEYAIRHNLSLVEAGAQGEHKLARGYLATPTYSAHWITDPGFREALSRYLLEERQFVDSQTRYLNAHSPFKRSGLN